MRITTTVLYMLLFVWPGWSQIADLPTLPDHIQATVAGLKEHATKAALLKTGKITINNQAFRVLRFQLSGGDGCMTGSGMPFATINEGDSLSMEARNYLLHFPPGYKLCFDQIEVKNTIGKRYYVNPFSLLILDEKTLPYKAQIGTLKDSSPVTVAAIRQAGKLICPNPNYKVIYCKMGINGGGALDCYYERSFQTDSFSIAEIKNIFGNLKPGGRLFLDSVKVRNQTGETFLLLPAIYRICP